MHPHLVAGEGLEPPSSAYETELDTTSSLTRDIFSNQYVKERYKVKQKL